MTHCCCLLNERRIFSGKTSLHCRIRNRSQNRKQTDCNVSSPFEVFLSDLCRLLLKSWAPYTHALTYFRNDNRNRTCSLKAEPSNAAHVSGGSFGVFFFMWCFYLFYQFYSFCAFEVVKAVKSGQSSY